MTGAGILVAVDTLPSQIARIALLRLAAEAREGVARSRLRSDLARVAGPSGGARAGATIDKMRLDDAVAELVTAGFATVRRGRLKATAEGLALAERIFGRLPKGGDAWRVARDGVLVARALDLALGPAGAGAGRAEITGLMTVGGLRQAVIERAIGLKHEKPAGPAALRARLADHVAGETRKAGRRRSTIDAEASRQLAARLIKDAPEASRDVKLISLIAADRAGAPRGDLAALRGALIRRLIGDGRAKADRAEAPVAARPADLAGFASHVKKLAAPFATGFPGNRRTFVAHAWDAVSGGAATIATDWAPGGQLDEERFKALLVEAHRGGHLELAGADLRDKRNLADVKRSAVAHLNTVWHLVRIDDEQD
ncbi:MAG: hypothetical protein R3D33_14875 [Hyphomicrobiaceae bacterium]